MTKKTVITTELAIKLLEFCVNLATHQDPFFYDGRGKGYKSKKSMLEDAADLLNETDNEFSIYSDRQLRMLLTKCLKEAPESYENCVDKSTFDCFQAIGIVVMPSKEEILEKYGPNHNFNYQFHFSSFNDRAIPLIKRIINKRNNNDNNFDDSSETKKRKLDVVSDSTTTSVSFKVN